MNFKRIYNGDEDMDMDILSILPSIFFKTWFFLSKAVNVESKSYGCNAAEVVFLAEILCLDKFIIFNWL